MATPENDLHNTLVPQLREEALESEFTTHLRSRLDVLVARMSPTSGALQRVTRGLMMDTDGLRKHYRPGDTETRE